MLLFGILGILKWHPTCKIPKNVFQTYIRSWFRARFFKMQRDVSFMSTKSNFLILWHVPFETVIITAWFQFVIICPNWSHSAYNYTLKLRQKHKKKLHKSIRHVERFVDLSSKCRWFYASCHFWENASVRYSLLKEI